MVARTLAALARRLRPAALGAACALVPPVMATAAVCSASDPLYPRRWVAAPNSGGGGTPLRVVQFNILADGLSARHPSNGGFTESPPESLAWDFRRDRLVAEVFRHFEEEAGPDVVAMQEVDHYDELAAEMRRRGYEGTWKAKPDSPCLRFNADLEDGCALFWRTDAVAVDELTTVNFKQLDSDGAPTGKASNQVAIVAQMRLLRGAAKGGAAAKKARASADASAGGGAGGGTGKRDTKKAFFRIAVKDNGKGMQHDDIPNMLGRVLSGTKYGVRQTRGKFGLGSKMALIWSKQTTGLPINITSAQPKQKFKSEYVLDIDIERNEPNVHSAEKTPNDEGWHGAELSVII